MPAGTQYPGELGQHRYQRRLVYQCQRAHHDVHRRVGQRQPVQIAGPELGVRHPFAGPVEHLGRAVHAHHAVPPRRQVLRVPAGAARGVEDGTGRQRVEDLVHDGLVDVEQAVARFVVARRPHAVPGLRVAPADPAAR